MPTMPVPAPTLREIELLAMAGVFPPKNLGLQDPMNEPPLQRCYHCDPYAYHPKHDGHIVERCWNHRYMDDLILHTGLPRGHEPSWRRGTWA